MENSGIQINRRQTTTVKAVAQFYLFIMNRINEWNEMNENYFLVNDVSLVSVNFGSFAPNRYSCFHGNAMETTNQSCMSWNKLSQTEHTPEH